MSRGRTLPVRSVACGLALLVAGLTVSVVAPAKDLGVRGATWPVAEPDLLAVLEGRLAALRDAGALARLKREARERARARIEAPPRVPGLAPAVRDRSRRLDPTVTVARDIAAPDGTVIARAGSRVHPFDHHPLDRALLFIDGTRAVEVAWALGHPEPATPARVTREGRHLRIREVALDDTGETKE